MGAIKEHYHDKIMADYSQMNASDSAKMARYETLKEIITICEQEVYVYERLFTALGNADKLRGQIQTANRIKEICEQKIKDIV